MLRYKIIAGKIAENLGYIPSKWEDMTSIVKALEGYEEDLQTILGPAVYQMKSPHSAVLKKLYGLDNDIMSREEFSKTFMITKARLEEVEQEAIDLLTNEYGIELLLERI